MSKIAFLFPGQGSQYNLMGKDFYDTLKTARQVFDLAKEATGLELTKLCFEEDERLNITEFTQIAMLTCEIAMLRCIEEKGIKADVCAGLSLGEYGALAASNAISDQDLFSLIRKRGIYMQKAYPEGGAMMAVLGLDGQSVAKVCSDIDGCVSVANYNCPGQIVITGEEKAVLAAEGPLKEAGAKRCIKLKVSGPFHSSLLEGASKELKEALKEVEVKDPTIPYITNVTAEYVTKKEPIKDLLTKQVASSVLWQQSMERLIEDGVTTFIEIGPGKTLTGFLKKINKEIKCYSVEKVDDLERLLEEVTC